MHVKVKYILNVSKKYFVRNSILVEDMVLLKTIETKIFDVIKQEVA